MSDGFKFDPVNMPRIDLSTTNHHANSVADSIAANQREMERSMQAVQRERERKEAAEADYREEQSEVSAPSSKTQQTSIHLLTLSARAMSSKMN